MATVQAQQIKKVHLKMVPIIMDIIKPNRFYHPNLTLNQVTMANRQAFQMAHHNKQANSFHSFTYRTL